MDIRNDGNKIRRRDRSAELRDGEGNIIVIYDLKDINSVNAAAGVLKLQRSEIDDDVYVNCLDQLMAHGYDPTEELDESIRILLDQEPDIKRMARDRVSERERDEEWEEWKRGIRDDPDY